MSMLHHKHSSKWSYSCGPPSGETGVMWLDR